VDRERIAEAGPKKELWITAPSSAFSCRTKKEPTMTTRAVEFLHVWVSENMTPFSQGEDNPEAKELARKCLAEAEERGISYTELKEAAGGDLVAFIARAIRRP
jgi:hypothetical protein